ncbi:hypothetical protein BBJ28_00008630 [Nothophytophthora sp. Chile5]|nr:hypothetical protein BBJ28_00008630 [Nothophytophthora sp. Chile5]
MLAGNGLRLRLLDPSVGVVSGGTRVVVHGVGFRPPPHSLIVRFRVNLEDADVSEAAGDLDAPPSPLLRNTVDVTGKFLMDGQLECVVPNFEREAKRAIAARTSLAASTASVNCAPQLVPLSVGVLLNGGEQRSNVLIFRLHQPLELQRIGPQSVLMASPSARITATLNILKLPGPVLRRVSSRGIQRPLEELEEMSVLPVYVRVRQTLERTGAVSEQTREGQWKLSPVGVYEIEFEAAALGFGPASVDLTLNRVDYFASRFDAPPEARGYRVHRDVVLRAVEPACISVTSGQVTEVRLIGEGFVESGDLVVLLSQQMILPQSTEAEGAARTKPITPTKEVEVAQLNATFHSEHELRCTVQANMSFGRTKFRVSLNGGRQFSRSHVVALFHRDRALQEISPETGSVTGEALMAIRLACLPVDDVDSPRQLQHLEPPRRIRVRFQAVDNSSDEALTKVVTADASPDSPGVLLCRTPNFIEGLKAIGNRSKGSGSRDHMRHFTVSVALGGDSFQGALAFGFYLPPLIRSITQHHGPVSGDTKVTLRMKHKVPPHLRLLVRFSSLSSSVNVTVDGHLVEQQSDSATIVSTPNPPTTSKALVIESPPSAEGLDMNPEYLVTCQTPLWPTAVDQGVLEAPHLTIVQVSYDAGVTFLPTIDPPPDAKKFSTLAKDMSYLCFLFYPLPVVRTAVPLSADILGGSYIRLLGCNLADHGSQCSVVFESPTMSRKVPGFIEKGELRCCAPPFNVGTARIFVSLNDEQYTQCELHDPETDVPLDFIFYCSPSVTRISPLCASVRQPSELHIFGMNLIETERIKVRVSFPANSQGSGRRPVFKDVPGKTHDGVITAISPTFSDEYANATAQVDVALNGSDFSGTSVPLRYFSRYSIARVDPSIGAFEIPVALAMHVAPTVVSDRVLVRLRLSVKHSTATEGVISHEKPELETLYGPMTAIRWTATCVEFMLPSLCNLVESLQSLSSVQVELSFDAVHFHSVGSLRDHYRVYNMPQITSITPLFGAFERETKIVAYGAHLNATDVIKLTLFLEAAVNEIDKAKVKARRSSIRPVSVPVLIVVAEVSVKRQRLTWTCPSLMQLRASPERRQPHVVVNSSTDQRVSSDGVGVGGMLLPERVTMQISVVDGQPMALPFVFRYYRAPTLVDMSPRTGYVCSGSLVSFEFAEVIATPTVDFRFGESPPTSGRVRDGRFVECFSPELPAGEHEVSVSFNEQHFESVWLVERLPKEGGEDGEAATKAPATFLAFPLPVFVLPPEEHNRIYAFGPSSGGTLVVIKGLGFIANTKIYVRFTSEFADAFDSTGEVIVAAKVVDNETIRCVSPPSRRLGRVALHLSYNLQQFSASTCFFEYHAPTRYAAKGVLCGPVSGRTPLSLVIEDTTGLPSLAQLLHCVVRFESEKRDRSGHLVDVEAHFDPDTRILSCLTPSWPSNELVALRVSLARGESGQFEDTRVKFLFYDPPEGVITIEPSAGPISGGTEVMAWCGSIVETGEITVSIRLSEKSTGIDDSSRSEVDGGSKPKPKPTTMLVKGEIVGDAVRFVTPKVDGACTALLSISLNSIDYTSAQSPLHFTYYLEPVLRRISPGWAAMEGANDPLVIEGEHIRDFGCKLLVRFCLQDAEESEGNDGIIVDARFLANSTASASGDGALKCEFPAATPGFYELEVSLNGQQFSHSLYVNNKFGNLSGTACTVLLPFRHFSSPFCLATTTGPAAGGSTIVLFLGGELLKLLAKETKCQVQFSPIRGSDRSFHQSTNAVSGSGVSPIKTTANVPADVFYMMGDIDHTTARITCRAPLLRVACVSHVDVSLPSGSAASSACQLFGLRPAEREKYYSYESPSITTLTPTCGPTAGGTRLVIEGTNILDTAQIFVRFRSSVNAREFVLVPATYSRTFPDGSTSATPLILCDSPPIEFLEKTLPTATDPTISSASIALSQIQPSPRTRDVAAAGKARTQTFQMLAEKSLKAQRACLALRSGGEGTDSTVLRITRPAAKRNSLNASDNATAEGGGASVLVDFTLNAGEQFIAHSVRFYYYQALDSCQIKWTPRHLPTQFLGGRQVTDSRLLTVTLPKTFRLTDAPENICFRFDGLNGLSPRRGSVFLATTPALYSPSPKTAAPNIAGKVLSANEVTCAVPDFPRPGVAQVFLSLNAQQFLRLGDLSFHPAVAIREERDHGPARFCSNIGGDRFALRCSASSMLQFLAPEDVTTLERQHQRVQNLGLRKVSVALESGGLTETLNLRSSQGSTEDKGALQVDPEVAGTEAENDEAEEQGEDGGEEENPNALGSWHARRFYTAQVLLIPPNPKLLKRVLVTVSRVNNGAEVGSSAPDEFGSCVFDMSDWSDEVLLAAVLPPSVGYASYSTVVEPKGRTPTTTHLVVTQLPSSSKLNVVAFGSCLSRVNLRVVDCDGKEVAPGVAAPLEGNPWEDGRMHATVLDHVALIRSASEVCCVCVDFGPVEGETPSNDSAQGESNIQVLIADSNGVQLCLSGPPVGSNVWVVARIISSSDQDSTSPATNVSSTVRIEPVDRLVQHVQDVLSPGQSSAFKKNPSNSFAASRLSSMCERRGKPPSDFVAMTFEFACTDSIRSIAASARARLVLSDSDDLKLLASSQQKDRPAVTLECSMPPLAFTGLATLVVRFGGASFSNSVTVHCYDPRSWLALALSPPCGQLPSALTRPEPREPMTLRIKGDNFVENRKILVRVSDTTRYFTVSGAVEQTHTLRLRVAAVKQLRALLGIGPQGPGTTVGGSGGPSTSPHKREDDRHRGSTAGAAGSGSSASALISTLSTFTFTLRLACGDQMVFASCRETSVLPAIASASVLSWEEQFELRVASNRRAPLLITAEISDASLAKPLEIAHAMISLDLLQEGSQSMRRCAARFEEHFKRGLFAGNASASSPASEVELLLQLSPLTLHPEFVVCQIPPPLLQQLAPQNLNVQVSSGDGFFSTPHCFQIYEPPTVTGTTPHILPRSRGGEVLASGSGFVNSGRVCVRLFAYLKNRFESCDEEQHALLAINRVERLQRANSSKDVVEYFTRDVEGSFVSSTTVKFTIPAHLASFNVFYRVSFDKGRAFTEASSASHVLLFSTFAVTPKGGPVIGNTYATLHGTNIDACVSSIREVTPFVRLSWRRGARELEHVVVSGECYPHEDAVYFYSPQSKFGLQNIAVIVELALVVKSATQGSSGSSTSDTTPHFGRDEVSFVMYKTPTIKSVTPLTALLCGLSGMEMIVQGLDEKAANGLNLAPKLRFKRRGQMQVADAQLVSEARFDCVVPRFNVTNAVPTELSGSALATFSTASKHRGAAVGSTAPLGAGVFGVRRPNGTAKLWTRTSGIFVALLGAKNLRASKKNACNPFAVIYVDKAQLKSTRKDGVFAPVWNELFDFEWSGGTTTPSVRVILENQLTADQSENLGHVELKLPEKETVTQPFAIRAWFPLRRIRGKYAQEDTEELLSSPRQHSKARAKPTPTTASTINLGEVELAVAFLPPALQSKRHTGALRTSILTVISSHPPPTKQSQPRSGREDRRLSFISKKEKLLRAFRQRATPASSVPTELTVELALNGQDFWSVAPSKCYSTLTPIVLDVGPKFICIAGGTALHLSGINFVNSGYIRVAFVVLPAPDSKQPLSAEHTVVVEAKYRSSSSLVCTTPPLIDLAIETSRVNVYLSLNGTDFDSIAFPKQLTKVNEVVTPASMSTAEAVISIDGRVEEEGEDADEVEEPAQKSPRKLPESNGDCAIILVNDQYIVNPRKSVDSSVGGSTEGELLPRRPAEPSNPGTYLLVPQLQVYLAPKITRARPTDGVYTSHLTIDGANFTDTKVATVSSSRMECHVPDFPRGVVVRIAVAMNGVEFVPCPGEMRVFQSPRLTEVFPNWPRRLSHSDRSVVRCQFTGAPLSLHVYREVPAVSVVAPMDGPIYGGFAIVVEGRGFLDTGKILVRFQLYMENQQITPRSEERKDENEKEVADALSPSAVSDGVHIDVAAKFVSTERVLCSSPPFPQEGVYMVLVALNGVEFSRVSDGSWFLAWQNWQKRKRLLSHALFSRTTVSQDATSTAATVGAAAASASLDEEDIERLRRKSSFMLPKIKSVMPVSNATEPVVTVAKTRGCDSLTEESSASNESDAELAADPRLLHWYPRSTAEERVSGRSLLALLEYLCGSPETQQVTTRRLRVAFRLKSSQSRGSPDTFDSDVALSLADFLDALRLIFPNALHRDLEELWHAIEHGPGGTVTFKHLMRRLLRNAGSPERRSRSPEPGPAHYDPRYTIVSSRESSALILPPANQEQYVQGLPSELLMDYDAAVQAVKPRPPRTVFRKRKFNTSWCNPVRPEDSDATPQTPRPPSGTLSARPNHRFRATKQATNSPVTGATADLGEAPDTEATQEISTEEQKLPPPSSNDPIVREPEPRAPAQPSTKEDAVRTPRTLSVAAAASKDRHASASASPASPAAAMARPPKFSGPNLFYNDIAPVYAKFLNSAEVQKFMKQ